MRHKNIALFWKLYVLLVREDGLLGTGMGNQGKLVKFTRGNWKVVISPVKTRLILCVTIESW